MKRSGVNLKWVQRPGDGAIIITACAGDATVLRSMRFVNAPNSPHTTLSLPDEEFVLYGLLDVDRVEQVGSEPVGGIDGYHLKLVCPLLLPARSHTKKVAEIIAPPIDPSSSEAGEIEAVETVDTVETVETQAAKEIEAVETVEAVEAVEAVDTVEAGEVNASRWPRLLATTGRHQRVTVDWSAYAPGPDEMDDIDFAFMDGRMAM